MNIKNRILPMLLALILSISLYGCGIDDKNVTTENETAESVADDSSEGSVEETLSTTVSGEDYTEQEVESDADNSGTVSDAEAEPVEGVLISFDYSRMSTHASNQMAIWIEDASGNLVKTVLVTNFTAGRRGYRNRDMALSAWVETADPDSKTDDEIDAITSATPTAGSLVYTWDMTDETGERIPDGRYTVKLEGTLFWESNVLYSAVFDTAMEDDELEITEVRSEPTNPENEEMIRNVRMEVLRGGD